ncbi:MAG: 2-dehydro-3-deoxyphosphogluconate aldolase, partial [Acidobacteriia bacterium]|nr:2-dehydro-3-deoxyphosphogluconate aldolase [Terriglobia bacterium]
MKIFPAQNVGGADFLKAVKEPFPQIELLPTKGVDFETAGAFI